MSGTKGHLLQVLQQLAQDRPLDRISISELARHAGVSRPTVVRHLGSKLELHELLSRSFPEAEAARPSTRERLVQLAVRNWGSERPGPPSVESLAYLAELSKSSVYWHFPSREDLLVAVAGLTTRVYDPACLHGAAVGGATQASPLELRAGLEGLLEQRLSFVRAYPRASAALAWLRTLGPEQAQDAVLAAERHFREAVRAWLSALARRGQLEPGADIEAFVALTEPLLLALEQRVGQQALAARLAAVLASSIERRG